MSKKLVVRNIAPKLPDPLSDMHAEIELGKSIRIFGSEYGDAYDRTFALGDIAEYDSYNLSYMGEIVSITAKNVIIQPGHGRPKKRLSLYQFSWRNKKFDAAAAQAANAEEMNYI